MPTTPSPAPPLDPPPADPAPPAEAVAPLMRGIAVLRCLAEAGGTLGLGELERATGLARATLDRVTATLARIGYVRVDGRDARLAPRAMEPGNAYLSALRLPALLGPHAEALADTLDESVSLAVEDGDGIRFIHQTPRRRTLSVSFRIGDLLPAERTAPGPLFAADWTEDGWDHWRARRAADPADLGFTAVPPRTDPAAGQDLPERAERARRQGWAVDDQLIEPGLVALAVPVRDPQGRTVCVASVVSHTSRHPAASLPAAFLPRLREAVAAMERTLESAPASGPASTAGSTPASSIAEAKNEMGREFIESLARGLAVLTAFGEGRAELPLTAVAEATGLARATARRALITLEHLGYVTTTRAHTFALTPRVLALGFPPLSRTTLPALARPHLTALAAAVGEAAYIAVLTATGDEIQCTASGTADRIMRVDITTGTRLPAYCTASGRVLLAPLPDTTRTSLLRAAAPRPLTARTVTDPAELARILDGVATDDYALVDGEMEEGLCALAVPVRDGTGTVVAAVDVALHTSRRTPQECLSTLLPALRATATAIESDLHVTNRFTRVPAH